MTLDLATLFFVTVVMLGLGGVLLLFAWLQNRSTTALAWWGSLSFSLHRRQPFSGCEATFPNSGRSWSATSSTRLPTGCCGPERGCSKAAGRRLSEWPRGALVWLLASQFNFFMQSLPLRIVVASTIVLTYCLLFVWELWQGRNEGLMSRWPVMAMVGLHGLFFLARVPAVTSLPFPCRSKFTGHYWRLW